MKATVPWHQAHRTALLEWLYLSLVLVAFGAYLGYSLLTDRLRIEAREKERLSHQCSVVSMNLSRQFGAINTALTGIVGEVPNWRKAKDGPALAQRHLKVLNNVMPGVMTFLVFDSQGTVEASDKPELVGRNFAQRDYFRAVATQPDAATLYVRPPFITTLGNFTMNLARMVPGPHGEFDGLVTAALDAEEFKVLLDSVIYRPDIRASLIHGDGVPFLMAPISKNVEGVDLAKPGSFFTRHMNSGRKTNVFTGTVNFVGDERMVALETIQDPSLPMDRPMVIAVDRRLQAVYAGWNRDLLKDGLTFALLALCSAGAMLLHQKQRRLARHAPLSAG